MQAARLVGELRYLRQMLDSMKRMITGQGLEEERGFARKRTLDTWICGTAL